MQNELRIPAGGLYPLPQTHAEARFKPGHGLQRRPSVPIEDVRDGRSSDPRFFGNPFDAPVAVSLSPQVDHHGLDHRVLGCGHIETVGPALVKAGRTAWLRSHHAFTVATGTLNVLLGVVVAAFGPQVGFASGLVRPQRQLQHRLRTCRCLSARPRRAGQPPAKNRMPYTRAHREVTLRACPTPLDIALNLLGERLPHQPRLLVGGGQLFGVNVRPVRVGSRRRVKSAHALNRTGHHSAFRDAQRGGGSPLSRKWGTR